jgi:opacity protein-like surface antigen
LILKGGVILDNSHRISLTYAPAFHDDADVHNFLAGYDYLIPVNSESKFYVGAHAGAASFKAKGDLEDDANILGIDLDTSGFAYGAQLGYIYNITKNVEFEIGAMYTRYNIDKDESGDYMGFDYNFEFELKDSFSTFIGFNYKF